MPIHNELAPLILTVVAQIPYGKVASYGQVARLAGLAKHARLVGYVLKHLDASSEIPWHRVVNHSGKIRTQSSAQGQNLQCELLTQEGIVVENNRVNLKHYAWQF
ncbi:MGMT family protein [Acinetobacter sp. B51(2017)]|uniref:MGMT family protein n=1 Tax=Acinetobacter sp. B51(2017) TaxID=2060938 RepID=UPI000F07D85F|nr:MGMT family protein [Acinetobacter sp. B51(2017)]